VKRLDTNVAGSSIEVFLEAPLDGRLISPSHHRIEKPVTTTIGQIRLAEAEARPVIEIIGQAHVKIHRLTGYLSCLRGLIHQ
jgi:hypothetical protein